VRSVTSPEMTSPEVTSSEMTSPELEVKGISFPGFFPVLPTFFSGTPLDSRYEQWNFIMVVID
jgi:hypothetical protein